MKFPDIYIIGSGNLASHLADVFTKHHLPLKGLIARNPKEGRRICRKTNIPFLPAISAISSVRPVVFCCISDDSLDSLMNELRKMNAFIVHCSGIKELPEKQSDDKCRFGVFYPVLSFSKSRPVTWKDVPVCIESPDKPFFNLLKSMAKQISAHPYAIGSKERSLIHLSAVFANNFTNLMYMISEDLLKDHRLDFGLMKPLILQTAQKALDTTPEDIQTGPGRRGDKKTISSHRKLLAEKPEMLKVYNILTAVIQRRYHS